MLGRNQNPDSRPQFDNHSKPNPRPYHVTLLFLPLPKDAAFVHMPSKTLLLCDALFATTSEPPPILTSEPEYLRALLFHARDDPLELVSDSPEARRKGWRRIILLQNFFFPGSAKGDLGLGPLLRLGKFEYGWGGWKPFVWNEPMAERYLSVLIKKIDLTRTFIHTSTLRRYLSAQITPLTHPHADHSQPSARTENQRSYRLSKSFCRGATAARPCETG